MNLRTFLTRCAAGALAGAVALALGGCGGGDGETAAVSSPDGPVPSASACPAAQAVQGLCTQATAATSRLTEGEAIE